MVAAIAIVASGLSLPPTLSGLRSVLPWTLMLASAALAAWYNRGRLFIAAASLLVAFSGYQLALGFGDTSIAARAVFTALSILVPLNVLAGMLLPEHGVTHHFNYRWLMAGVAEIAAVTWVASAGRSDLSGLAWAGALDHWALLSPPMPAAGRLLLLLALVAAMARAWPRDHDTKVHAIDIGVPAMLVAFFIACEWVTTPAAFDVFNCAAASMLLAALMQESHRLAFRDELTGLRSRRALDERMRGLGPAFVIAMVDVDHFKQFNDTHGHATGDQVLKLVAARLADAGGGGVAYRYGGEEFAVLFAERSVAEVLPHAEALRASIERYEMAVRGPDRPKDPELGTTLRHSRVPVQFLSVTVSIGLAVRTSQHSTPTMVIHAADAALYRAKHAGRNRVSQ